MIELPQKFRERMTRTLGDAVGEFFASYDRNAYKAIRVNTLKISVDDFKKLSPFALKQVPWEPCGFYVGEEKAGKTLLHEAGLYYVQEPSAMCAAPLLSVRAGEKVLDMCSAPGGKGTQLAQAMRGEGIIVLNEVNLSRAKILSQNVERLGIINAAVISCPCEQIAEHFEGYFDKILVDAPCSGEGMFLKEPNAIPEWSETTVIKCAERQALILECAQRALAVGGLLVYSTCTFSREEDEEQIEKFLLAHKNFKLISMNKLYPHECKGEGHFAALLQKTDGEEGCNVPDFKVVAPAKNYINLYRDFERGTLNITFENLHSVGTVLYSLPKNLPQMPKSCVALRIGVRLGEVKGDRFEPSHSLATCLKKGQAKSIDVDEQTAYNYLRGMTFECSADLSGWLTVTYRGYPLGWCKAVGGVAKNHLPKGVRI